MAVGSAIQRIGPINPSSLIGQPENIVEPRAVAALADAFRQGFITTDEITSRLGQLARTKEKAELQMTEEAIAPEAQAMRAQQTAANTAQGALVQAQAERAKVLQEYPAVAYFDKLAPVVGLQEPKLPDGTPDYKQMEKLGAQLAVWQAQKADAQARLDNIVDEKSADGSTLFSKTKQGEIVDRGYVQKLREQATASFQQQAPGTFTIEPRAAAPAAGAAPEVMPRTQPPAPTITPEVTATPALGTPVGMGTSLGPPKEAAVKPADPIKQAQDLAAAENIIPVIDAAKQAVNRGKAVGPLQGSFPAEVANRLAAGIFGTRQQEFKDQRQLEIAISSKILEGAQVMKGNLSDKDVRFLKDTVPKLTDSEDLWNDYLDRWKRMAELNVDILSGKIPKPTGDLFAPSDWEAPPAAIQKEASGNLLAPAAPNNAPVRVNNPAEAPPTAQYIQAPDGRIFKNPKYQTPAR